MPQNSILERDCLMVYLLKSLFYLLIKGSLTIQNDFCPKCGSNDLLKMEQFIIIKPKMSVKTADINLLLIILKK